MTVQKFTQPDYSSQSGTVYPTGIDKAIAVHHRLAGPFATHEQDAASPQPDLSVRVDAGYIFDGVTLTEVAARTVSGFTIPSAGQHRIDRVVLDPVTGTCSRVAGTAATGSPTASPPSIPAGYMPVCQVLITDSDTVILNSMITDERLPVWRPQSLTLATEQPTTSGVAIDFTGIPSWVKRITLQFSSVSTNGTSPLQIQLGDAGGIENTGYSGTVSQLATSSLTTANTAGAGLRATVDSGAGANYDGAITLTLEDSTNNTWVATGTLGRSETTVMCVMAGAKTLSAALDRIRLTTVNGTDAFDGGAVNILYE